MNPTLKHPRNACKPSRPLHERWPVHCDLESPEAKAQRLLYIERLTPEQRRERLQRATGNYRKDT